MPLGQLVEYFNERFQRGFGVQEPLLRLRRGRVEAVVGEMRLATLLKPIRLAESPLIVRGHDATLRCYVDGGNPGAALQLLGAAEGAAVVNLDRLCRTLHMLNYLPLADEDGLLHVEVNPRHVLSVKRNHGAYFQEVLANAGLTPEQVVIGVPFDHLSTSYQLALAQGLNNYRQRGYQVALKLAQGHPEQIRQSTAMVTRLLPDFVKLDRALLSGRAGGPAPRLREEQLRRLLAVARGGGCQIIQEGIETDSDGALAAALKVDLVQGDHFEQAGCGVRYAPARATEHP